MNETEQRLSETLSETLIDGLLIRTPKVKPVAQKPPQLSECVVCAKKFGEDVVLGKNRDRNYPPELKIVRELTSEGVELCYVVDQDTGWSEGMNSLGIGIVNSALAVKHDEKEKKIVKKTKRPSKDGIRIKEALSKKTIDEVVESLVNFDDGVKGHTIVSDGQTTKVIENTSETEPTITTTDLTDPVVRTNHGIINPNSGYAPGNDRDSSEIRMKNATDLVVKAKAYEEMFPLFYNHQQDKGPKYDVVRTQHYLWTSSQQLMNLNKNEIILYLVPEAVKFTGIENNLPNEYDAKISCDIRKYDSTPMAKYKDYVTTSTTDKKSAIKEPTKVAPVTTETFSNYITEETKQLSVEAKGKVTKTIGIYPGRFQPAGIHHYKTYKWLQNQFSISFVATSNKTDGSKSPLNFKEKRMVWLKHGVKNVKQVKNPYVCEEIVSKYDAEKTAVVFIFGAKDAGRLKTTKADGSPAYYQPYKENKNNLKGYEEHGYFIVAPHVSIKVLGKEVNGTRIRELLGSPKYDKETKTKAFEELFGWYDEKIFNYLTKKFGTLFENMDIFDGFLEKYPKVKTVILNELSSITGLGKLMVDDGPTVFYPEGAYETASASDAQKIGYEVINYIVGSDANRNTNFRRWPEPEGPVPSVSFFPAGAIDEKTPMNQIEFEKSKHAYEMWNKFSSHSAELLGHEIVNYLGAEMSVRKRDMKGDETQTGLHSQEDETAAESSVDDVEGHDTSVKDTTKEKKNSKTFKEEFTSVLSKIDNLLLEGGAAGHMSHPFDDMGLTFGDLKEMVRRALTGNLHIEGNITEKLDGQALSFSWKNGKVIFARNKGQLENDGAEAPDVAALTQMFSDRPENIRDAFVHAANDLQSAIKGLSDKQKDKMFKEGQRFMAVEVMTPKTQNIIPQDKEMLVFHGLSAYDEEGVQTNFDREGNDISSSLKGSGRMLAGMIKQINADVQERFEIHPPVIVSLPKSKDFEKSQQTYFSKIDNLKKEFKLKDSDELMLYHQTWWENFITKSAKKYRVSLTNDVLTGLIKRWAFFDKAFQVKHIRKGLVDSPKFLEWVLKYDKGDQSKQYKENMLKLELIFLQLGGEVMQNVSGFLAAGGREDIAKDFKKTASELQKSTDIKVLNKYKLEMRRLESIGGLDAIVPSEGIVFEYKGGIYKLTGAFAPINQLNGIVPGRF